MSAKDYAISIATIHHLASHERRKLAVQVGEGVEVKCVDTDPSTATSTLRFTQPRPRLNLRLGRRAGRAVEEEHTYRWEWK